MKNYTFKFKDKDIVIDSSWEEFFNSQKFELKKIAKDIGNISTFTPDVENIFKIFKKPLDKIQYVILGQDPYPQKGVATGRAFEVVHDDGSEIESWEYKDIKPSLQNILKSIYYLHHDMKTPVNSKIEVIRNNCDDIKSPNELFCYLEENGVFLLNLSLTCVLDKPNSHKAHWEKFTHALLDFLGNKKELEIKWLIWGNDAKNAIKDLNLKEEYISKTFHPSYAKGRNHFIKNSGFADKKLLNLCLKKPAK